MQNRRILDGRSNAAKISLEIQHDVTMAMSLKDLPLEQINLTSGPDKIKLRLDAMLQLRVPDDMAHSGNEEILLSLASGKLWATRSSSCSLDFFIDLDDDEELDSENWIHLVESLGHRIRDAHVSLPSADFVFSSDDF